MAVEKEAGDDEEEVQQQESGLKGASKLASDNQPKIRKTKRLGNTCMPSQTLSLFPFLPFFFLFPPLSRVLVG